MAQMMSHSDQPLAVPSPSGQTGCHRQPSPPVSNHITHVTPCPPQSQHTWSHTPHTKPGALRQMPDRDGNTLHLVLPLCTFNLMRKKNNKICRLSYAGSNLPLPQEILGPKGEDEDTVPLHAAPRERGGGPDSQELPPPTQHQGWTGRPVQELTAPSPAPTDSRVSPTGSEHFPKTEFH